MRYLLRILALSLLCVQTHAGIPGLDGGHIKLRGVGSAYPDDSVFRDVVGDSAYDQGADLRLKFSAASDRFSIATDYQLIGQFGDSLDFPRQFQGLFLSPPPVPNDDRRWWDLTDQISENNSRVVVQRLDRLYVDYTGDKAVVRFGRQAVSWGNGLIYNPMDFLNPFDPAAVDTEYKVGDDMLYGQYLLDRGDDWQFVSVRRRDEDGDVSSQVSSTALKFHGFGLEWEYDLLLAEHFDEFIVGAGGLVNVGESVVRGDIVLTDAEDGWETSLVANWSYSWVWGGRNVSGVVEYFFNGFGLRESDYTPEKIREDTDLVERIARGEPGGGLEHGARYRCAGRWRAGGSGARALALGGRPRGAARSCCRRPVPLSPARDGKGDRVLRGRLRFAVRPAHGRRLLDSGLT